MIILVWQESEPAHHLLGFCSALSIDHAAKKLGLRLERSPKEEFPWRNNAGFHIHLSEVKKISEA